MNTKLSRNEKIYSILFILFFILIAISYFYSQNKDEALRKLILKLPILLTPLALLSFKNLQEKSHQLIVGILNYALFFPAFVSVYNYLLNKKLYDSLILESKPLSIEFGYGIYHIQFSIILAITIIFGVFSLYHFFKQKNFNNLFWIVLFLVFFNCIFIHILSARTGLLALYIGLTVFILQLFKNTPIKHKIRLSILSICLPILIIFVSSSLQNRIINTFEDIKVVWYNANANDYSFAMRVKAWKNSVDVIQNNIIFGVGIGDAEAVLFQNFEKVDASILPQNRRNPHLQFLESWVQSGILSAILFLLILVYSVFKFKLQKNWLLLSISLLLLIASCFESILERQASVVAFSFFLAFANFYPKKNANDKH